MNDARRMGPGQLSNRRHGHRRVLAAVPVEPHEWHGGWELHDPGQAKETLRTLIQIERRPLTSARWFWRLEPGVLSMDPQGLRYASTVAKLKALAAITAS